MGAVDVTIEATARPVAGNVEDIHLFESLGRNAQSDARLLMHKRKLVDNR